MKVRRYTLLITAFAGLLILTECSDRRFPSAQDGQNTSSEASSALDTQPAHDRNEQGPRLERPTPQETITPQEKRHSSEAGASPESYGDKKNLKDEQPSCGKDFFACKPYPMRFLWNKEYILQRQKEKSATITSIEEVFHTPQGFMFREVRTINGGSGPGVYRKDWLKHYDIYQKKVLFEKDLGHRYQKVEIIIASPYYIEIRRIYGPHRPNTLTQIFVHNLSDGKDLLWDHLLQFETTSRYVQVSYTPKSKLMAIRNYNKLLVYNMRGQLKWKHTFKYAISCNPTFDKDDNIYLCSEGYITSFTIKGKERWKTWGYERDLHPSTPTGTFALSFGPSGLLYAPSLLPSKHDPYTPNGGFVRTYTKSGKKVRRMIRSPYSTANGPILTGSNNKILYGIWGAKIHAYTADGQKRWDVDAQTYNSNKVHPTVLADGTLLSGNVRNVVLYEAKTGKQKRILPINEMLGSPFVFVRDGKLYVVGARSKSLNKVGILEYHYPIAPLPKTGWPMLNGGPEQHRRER